MSIFGIPVDEYWASDEVFGKPEFRFRNVMSRHDFWNVWSVLKLPDEDNTTSLEEDEEDAAGGINAAYISSGFKRVNGLIRETLKMW